MAKLEKSVHKKSRGRPPGRQFGETIPVRLAPEMIEAADKWAANKGLTRSKALRALIERGLKK
jgi:predicted DNA-binding protein